MPPKAKQGNAPKAKAGERKLSATRKVLTTGSIPQANETSAALEAALRDVSSLRRDKEDRDVEMERLRRKATAAESLVSKVNLLIDNFSLEEKRLEEQEETACKRARSCEEAMEETAIRERATREHTAVVEKREEELVAKDQIRASQFLRVEERAASQCESAENAEAEARSESMLSRQTQNQVTQLEFEVRAAQRDRRSAMEMIKLARAQLQEKKTIAEELAEAHEEETIVANVEIGALRAALAECSSESEQVNEEAVRALTAYRREQSECSREVSAFEAELAHLSANQESAMKAVMSASHQQVELAESRALAKAPLRLRQEIDDFQAEIERTMRSHRQEKATQRWARIFIAARAEIRRRQRRRDEVGTTWRHFAERAGLLHHAKASREDVLTIKAVAERWRTAALPAPFTLQTAGGSVPACSNGNLSATSGSTTAAAALGCSVVQGAASDGDNELESSVRAARIGYKSGRAVCWWAHLAKFSLHRAASKVRDERLRALSCYAIFCRTALASSRMEARSRTLDQSEGALLNDEVAGHMRAWRWLEIATRLQRSVNEQTRSSAVRAAASVARYWRARSAHLAGRSTTASAAPRLATKGSSTPSSTRPEAHKMRPALPSTGASFASGAAGTTPSADGATLEDIDLRASDSAAAGVSQRSSWLARQRWMSFVARLWRASVGDVTGTAIREAVACGAKVVEGLLQDKNSLDELAQQMREQNMRIKLAQSQHVAACSQELGEMRVECVKLKESADAEARCYEELQSQCATWWEEATCAVEEEQKSAFAKRNSLERECERLQSEVKAWKSSEEAAVEDMENGLAAIGILEREHAQAKHLRATLARLAAERVELHAQRWPSIEVVGDAASGETAATQSPSASSQRRRSSVLGHASTDADDGGKDFQIAVEAALGEVHRQEAARSRRAEAAARLALEVAEEECKQLQLECDVKHQRMLEKEAMHCENWKGQCDDLQRRAVQLSEECELWRSRCEWVQTGTTPKDSTQGEFHVFRTQCEALEETVRSLRHERTEESSSVRETRVRCEQLQAGIKACEHEAMNCVEEAHQESRQFRDECANLRMQMSRAEEAEWRTKMKAEAWLASPSAESQEPWERGEFQTRHADDDVYQPSPRGRQSQVYVADGESVGPSARGTGETPSPTRNLWPVPWPMPSTSSSEAVWQKREPDNARADKLGKGVSLQQATLGAALAASEALDACQGDGWESNLPCSVQRDLEIGAEAAAKALLFSEELEDVRWDEFDAMVADAARDRLEVEELTCKVEQLEAMGEEDRRRSEATAIAALELSSMATEVATQHMSGCDHDAHATRGYCIETVLEETLARCERWQEEQREAVAERDNALRELHMLQCRDTVVGTRWMVTSPSSGSNLLIESPGISPRILRELCQQVAFAEEAHAVANESLEAACSDTPTPSPQAAFAVQCATQPVGSLARTAAEELTLDGLGSMITELAASAVEKQHSSTQEMQALAVRVAQMASESVKRYREEVQCYQEEVAQLHAFRSQEEASLGAAEALQFLSTSFGKEVEAQMESHKGQLLSMEVALETAHEDLNNAALNELEIVAEHELEVAHWKDVAEHETQWVQLHELIVEELQAHGETGQVHDLSVTSSRATMCDLGGSASTVALGTSQSPATRGTDSKASSVSQTISQHHFRKGDANSSLAKQDFRDCSMLLKRDSSEAELEFASTRAELVQATEEVTNMKAECVAFECEATLMRSRQEAVGAEREAHAVALAQANDRLNGYESLAKRLETASSQGSREVDELRCELCRQEEIAAARNAQFEEELSVMHFAFEEKSMRLHGQLNNAEMMANSWCASASSKMKQVEELRGINASAERALSTQQEHLKLEEAAATKALAAACELAQRREATFSNELEAEARMCRSLELQVNQANDLFYVEESSVEHWMSETESLCCRLEASEATVTRMEAGLKESQAEANLLRAAAVASQAIVPLSVGPNQQATPSRQHNVVEPWSHLPGNQQIPNVQRPRQPDQQQQQQQQQRQLSSSVDELATDFRKECEELHGLLRAEVAEQQQARVEVQELEQRCEMHAAQSLRMHQAMTEEAQRRLASARAVASRSPIGDVGAGDAGAGLAARTVGAGALSSFATRSLKEQLTDRNRAIAERSQALLREQASRLRGGASNSDPRFGVGSSLRESGGASDT